MAQCKCGRSPTGECIGWHSLSHPAFLKKLREHELRILKQEYESQKNKNTETPNQ